MRIEFDPAKDAINRDKHGVSLAFGERVFDDPAHVVVETTRMEDGERRFRAIGMVAKRLWTAVHPSRASAVRIISVRKSNDGEQRTYDRPKG